MWSCTPPPQTQPGCDPIVPNRGAPCDAGEGTVCYVDPCLPGAVGAQSLEVTCIGGTWRWVSEDCPYIPPPVCAAPDTPIATPLGERPIAELEPGDLVYTAGALGVSVVPLVRVSRTAVKDHHVVRLSLDGGETLFVSGGHPTADGRFFSDLRRGDALDGAAVVDATVVPYAHDFTYDVLPAGETGAYYAGGVLIGSTLR